MTNSRKHTAAASCRAAFLSWARRAVVPLPTLPDEDGECVWHAVNRMVTDQRFVLLGEPDHFMNEKYPFRLAFMEYLFQRGWRHAAMETERSIGWRVDLYLETGDICMPNESGK